MGNSAGYFLGQQYAVNTYGHASNRNAMEVFCVSLRL